MTKVKADTPYVLKGSSNTTYTLTTVDEEVEVPTDNKLLISDSSTGDGVYVIDTTSEKATFNKWNDGLLGGGHPYLPAIENVENNLTICIIGSGDANCDGVVDSKDIEDIANFIMGEPTSETFDEKAANANEDDKVNAADIVEVVNIIKTNP